MLQRAIINFCEMAWKNKELLIVVTEMGYYDQVRSFLNSPKMAKVVANCDIRPGTLNVHLLENENVMPLVLIRAVAKAHGDWMVCWDDDNLSHPDRFGLQLERTSKERPSMLMDSLYYFYDSDELFITSYAQPSGETHERCAAASMMFHRDALPDFRGGNNTPWTMQYLNHIKLDYDLIAGEPQLFMAGSNGDNWRGDLHRRIGSKLPATWTRGQIEKRKDEVAAWLKNYTFPSPTVDVCGKDAQAIQVTEMRTWASWLDSPLPPDDWRVGLPSPQRQQRLQAEQNEQRRLQKIEEEKKKRAAAKAAEEEGKGQGDKPAPKP